MTSFEERLLEIISSLRGLKKHPALKLSLRLVTNPTPLEKFNINYEGLVYISSPMVDTIPFRDWTG